MSVLCIALTTPLLAQDKRRLKDTSAVLKEALNNSGGIPQTTFDKALCIAVYPSVKKIGAGVGVTYGRGVLSCRVGLLPGGAWSAPAMYTLDAGSVGPQFGGFSADYVVFVMTETAADKVLSGKLKLSAEAGAYLGSSGATTQGLNDTNLGAQALIYARPKGGVFAGASLGDASMMTDEKANRELYGRPITATEIVRDGKVPVPDAAEPFIAVLPESTKGN
jgi:lipid-binding SYLF domain-containing protein